MKQLFRTKWKEMIQEKSSGTEEKIRAELDASQDEVRQVFLQLYQLEREQSQDVDLIIHLCQRALSIIDRENFPILWAAFQVNLGSSLGQRNHGDLAENHDTAIAAYGSALAVYSRNSFPSLWAMIHHNLGTAYCKRISGERIQNLHWAIDSFNAALEIRTKKRYPVEWARSMAGLGDAYQLCGSGGDREKQYQQTLLSYAAPFEFMVADFQNENSEPSV